MSVRAEGWLGLAKQGEAPRPAPAELITDEIGRADGAMLRTDTKAGLLRAVFSPITAVGLAVLTKVTLHPVVTALAAIAAGLFGTAVLQLLWTIRPQLTGSGLLVHGSMTEQELKDHFAGLARDHERWHCERLVVVSQLAVRKFPARAPGLVADRGGDRRPRLRGGDRADPEGLTSTAGTMWP